MNILISCAGRRVSLVKAFQKELKKSFPQSKVFASDADPKLAAACYIADQSFAVPRLDDSNYVPFLINQCKLNDISLIIPTIDTELLILSQYRDQFIANGIFPLVASQDFILTCLDKRLTHPYFNALDIVTAKEYDKENYVLPMYLKPCDGSRSVDNYIITSENQLQERFFKYEKLMFLEYLDHKLYDEFTCDLYYSRDHQLKCVVPRKRLEVRDGEVSKGLTQNNLLVPYIKKRLNYIEGAIGCLTAQFFVHKNNSTIYGIEINARFGGGYPLSYLAGANFPQWIIEEYLLGNKLTDKFDCWEDQLLMIRYDEEILIHGYQG